ncbi:uncharacterized protein LOC126687456 [Mercurialis annua]|uniref:uncharacterized protein LOC126687456 n=1 Tax=Mercurialis annua TaxID=3986 RepID=UPI0024ADC88D|nr:uncharacterized protein LOC126687456 [Mercurialis annua]
MIYIDFPGLYAIFMSLPINFITWNCRGGLLSFRKQSFIRNLVSKHNPSFIGLVESKKENIDAFLVRKLWPNLDFDFSFVPSIGSSGGLLIIWNSVLLHNVSVTKGSRWICMDFSFSGFSIRHILVYASNAASERSSFWAELAPLICYPGLIIISGDFNEILKPEERINCQDFTASMLALHDFLNTTELMDIPLHAICSSNEVTTFVQKIKKLHLLIKEWNATVFGNQNKIIKDLSEEILQLDILADSRQLLEDERNRLACCKSDLWTAEKAVENMWIQKSRLNWSIKGDKNSKFFHSIASMHYRNNHIYSVEVDGISFSDPHEIRNHIRSFYSALYDRNHHVYSDISGLDFNYLFAVQVSGSSKINDCRPISLVNGMYKLLSKCLSIRLAPLLPSVISDYQHAFIKGRSIMDCAMIANELVHLASKRKDSLYNIVDES